ncbi:MAG: TIGR03032 family protein [Planctomycetaceae bacterium]|nr:TIGR03032 family protein [Planctomycetaceae bacterium]
MNPGPNDPASQITCSVTDGFAGWLQASGGSLAVTTYQAGKLALIGWDGRQPTLLLRDFEKPLGIVAQGPRFAMATRHDVTVFANAPLLARDYLEESPGKYDALYLPRVSYHTGDLNVHDLAFGKEGLWIVNTRFGCLAGLSHDHCFVPRWKPPFLTELAPEDRCHLNGLAMVDGEPRYVTALGTTDSPGAWREKKADGGVMMQVPSGEILLRGLSMPHSPRWHQGAVWFLNSGTGELCRHQPGANGWDVVCGLPAYLRGLCLLGDYAIVGMSTIREKHIFGGLPVQQRHEKLLCGIAIVDLKRGVEIGRWDFGSGCTELYEVQFLAGVQRPMVLNLQQPATRDAFPASDFSYWLRPSKMVQDFSQLFSSSKTGILSTDFTDSAD